MSHITSSFLNHLVSGLGVWESIRNSWKVVSPSISDSETSVVAKLGSLFFSPSVLGLPSHSVPSASGPL